MRGSAVDTMVWSRQASSTASTSALMAAVRLPCAAVPVAGGAPDATDAVGSAERGAGRASGWGCGASEGADAWVWDMGKPPVGGRVAPAPV
ncbi:hypothetical protein GCM10014715_88040 [Streptomyces spiralis]|uniref:Uncharacterized protein n=1 Tax=Streptomyces spiralis TaxID=66376 RepID=A0A919APB5_9ACTN|nr:hypothetical protein GCM10014715_88040 [Streptomyces spiralis]